MSAPQQQLKSPRPVGRRIIRLGTREIVTEGIVTPIFHDLFHHFMTVSWPQLFATLAAFFLVFDMLFGLLYYLAPGCIANLNPPGFAGDFFFSVETLATVGYGEMHPATFYGHVVAMIEIFVGLMSLALITGLMFARFSRPQARFIFTRNGVVRPIAGKIYIGYFALRTSAGIWFSMLPHDYACCATKSPKRDFAFAALSTYRCFAPNTPCSPWAGPSCTSSMKQAP